MPDQVAQFSLLNGLAGKKDPRILPAGTLVTAQNVAYDRLGMATKRPGNTSLATTAIPGTDKVYTGGTIPSAFPIANPAGCFAFGQEQVTIAGNRVYGALPNSSLAIMKDEVPEAVGTRRSISGDSATDGAYSADVCQTSNGFRVYAWVRGGSTGNGGVTIKVFDAATGALVFQNVVALDSTAYSLRVVACGTYAIVLVQTTTNALLSINVAPSASGTAITPLGTLLTFSSTYQAYDACSNAAGTQLLVTYSTSAGQGLLYTNLPYLTGGSLGIITGSSGAARACAIAENAGTIYVAWTTGTTIQVSGQLDGSPLTQTFSYSPGSFSTQPLRMACAAFTPTTAVICGDGITGYGVQSFVVNSSGAVTAQGSTVGANIFGGAAALGTQLVYLASRPVTYNGRSYALLFYASTTQPTYVWADLELVWYDPVFRTAPRAVAVVAPRIAAQQTLSNYQPPANVIYDGSGNLYAPCSVLEGGGVQASSGAAMRVWETRLNFKHPAIASSSTIGKSVAVNSSVYDGSRVTELGFITYPEGITFAPGAGGSMTASSSYQYMFIRAWTTASGEQVYSTFVQAKGSQALSVATGAGQNSVAFYNIPGLAFTSKTDSENPVSPPVIYAYRTQPGGTTFNFVAIVTSTTWTDTYSDASIASNPLLYFTPGFPGTVLDYVCPPSSSWTWTAGNRIWIIGDDLRTVWFSNTYVEGSQPQFNEGLTFQIQDGSDLIGGAPLDDKVVIFSKIGIYYTNGTGPTPTGSGNFYPTPARIQSDVGCIDPRSIVTIPDGIMFLSAKGLCVLGRDLSVNYLDAPSDILKTYPNVTSAVLFPERNEVRIALNNGTNGVDLVASYWAPAGAYQYRWSTFVKYDSGAAVAGAMSAGACYVNGSYRWLASSGYAYQEDTTGTNYWDGTPSAASYVVMWCEGEWYSPTGPIAWQRIKRFVAEGSWWTPHDLNFGIAVDYGASYSGAAYADTPTSQNTRFLSPVNDSLTLENVRIHAKRQKVGSFRWSISDAFASTESTACLASSGKGFSLSAVGLTFQPKATIGKGLGSERSG